MDGSDSSDRRLYRKSLVDHIEGPEEGEVFCNELVQEVSESADGVVDERERRVRLVLECGHVSPFGQAPVRCEACSKKCGRTALVCAACSVRCAKCGSLFCMEHTRSAGDNKRYCAKCFRRLPRGLRTRHSQFGNSGRQGFLAWLLEWW